VKAFLFQKVIHSANLRLISDKNVVVTSAKTYEELVEGFNFSAKLTDTKSTAINNVWVFIFLKYLKFL